MEKSVKESSDEKGPKLWEDENKWALSQKKKAQRSEARHLLALNHITSHHTGDEISAELCVSFSKRKEVFSFSSVISIFLYSFSGIKTDFCEIFFPQQVMFQSDFSWYSKRVQKCILLPLTIRSLK